MKEIDVNATDSHRYIHYHALIATKLFYFRHYTPLFMAALHGRLTEAKLLLASGARVFLHDTNGWRAYTHAVYRGQRDVSDLLKIHEGDKVYHCLFSLYLPNTFHSR